MAMASSCNAWGRAAAGEIRCRRNLDAYKVVYFIIQQPGKGTLLEKAVIENKGKQPEMLSNPKT